MSCHGNRSIRKINPPPFVPALGRGRVVNPAGRVSRHTAIDSLPDEMLMEIFRCDRLVSLTYSLGRSWEWYRLVHVCRRWRYIIFNSPRSLDLQLLCTYGTQVRNNLYCWPALPIVMRYARFSNPRPRPVAARDEDNIIAALQHPNHIHMIQLAVTTPLLKRLATLRQAPFPTLVHLELMTQTKCGLTLHNECFGEAAPRLRTLRTVNIGFSALPQLLLLAPNLVSLHLDAIPVTGYVSPETLATCLSTMTCLTTFHLHFLSPTSLTSLPVSADHPARYAVLPALKYFSFQGYCWYLEHLLSGIRTPLLKYIDISFFNQTTIFDTPQLFQFVCHAEMPRSYDEARVFFSTVDISLTLTRRGTPHCMGFRVRCQPLNPQLSCITGICHQFSSILFGVQQLDIDASLTLPIRQTDMGVLSWLGFFRPFRNVERLRMTKETASHVARALGKEVSMGMLPGMRELYIEEHAKFSSAQLALAPFIRRRSNHPIIVHRWEPNSNTIPS
ncbi:hypothetical protein BGW80DRAFT_1337900 [Lactifluus volemus]|nr:hypothetical protein BGW80DRAFT_1337900 [Lactifluus volemus]